MTTITVPAKYVNGVITPLKTIKADPIKVSITLEYTDVPEKEMTLAEYINSDEYKNEKGDFFNSAEELILDLKKQRKSLGK